MSNSSKSADILCDHAFVYQTGDKLPTVVRQDEVMGGTEATICFADDFNFDINGNITGVLTKPSPTLSLNVEIVGRKGMVVLHAPLSAIQCIDFK